MVGFYMTMQCWRIGYNQHVCNIFTVETKCQIANSFDYCKNDSQALFTVTVALHPSIRKIDQMRIIKESIDVTTGIFATGFWTTNSNLSYINIYKNNIGVDWIRFR